MEENKDINMESSNGDEEIIYTGSSNPQINEYFTINHKYIPIRRH